MFGKKKNPDPKTGVDYEKLGRGVEKALIKDYIYFLGSTRRQIWSGFVRGVATGFGGVVGATLVVALLSLLLSALVRSNVSPFDDIARAVEMLLQGGAK